MMETVIWHRGKSRTFTDEAGAAEWIKEIDMARSQKRAPKIPPTTAPDAVEPPIAAVATVLTIPKCCKDCDIQTEEGNTGGFFASHPGRLGGRINGSFTHGEDTTTWLEVVHAQES